MTVPQVPGGPEKKHRRQEVVIAVLAAVFTLVLAGLYYLLRPEELGPRQPISFSHRFHVSTKELSCFLCHAGAIDTPRAGIPPLQTCLLCHSHIIIDHPEILKLRDHYDQRRPVQWVRVNNLPDYVYFDHSIHLHRGIDCGRCHGNVSQMDRVAPVFDFKMGFCVQCHRDCRATHDCLACHR